MMRPSRCQYSVMEIFDFYMGSSPNPLFTPSTPGHNLIPALSCSEFGYYLWTQCKGGLGSSWTNWGMGDLDNFGWGHERREVMNGSIRIDQMPDLSISINMGGSRKTGFQSCLLKITTAYLDNKIINLIILKISNRLFISVNVTAKQSVY